MAGTIFLGQKCMPTGQFYFAYNNNFDLGIMIITVLQDFLLIKKLITLSYKNAIKS